MSQALTGATSRVCESGSSTLRDVSIHAMCSFLGYEMGVDSWSYDTNVDSGSDDYVLKSCDSSTAASLIECADFSWASTGDECAKYVNVRCV